MRASDPRRTGTATSRAVSVAERWNASRKRGAKAATSPQAAKQTANERVPRVRCRAGRGARSGAGAFIGSLSIVPRAISAEPSAKSDG